MIKPRLTVTGINEAIQGAELAEKLLKLYVGDALHWFGTTVTREAKEDHPYQDRTGALTRSIGYTVEIWTANTIQINIYATMSYAPAVEFGTATSRAFPFLFPKFYKHIDELMQRINAAVNRALTEGGAAGGATTRRGGIQRTSRP